MKEKHKTICIVLITLSVIVCAFFYAWDIWKKQRYYRMEECNDRYEVSWNFESDTCEKRKDDGSTSFKIDEFLENYKNK